VVEYIEAMPNVAAARLAVGDSARQVSDEVDVDEHADEHRPPDTAEVDQREDDCPIKAAPYSARSKR
jgi:hypothetical protein